MPYLRLICVFGLFGLGVAVFSPLSAQSQLNLDLTHFPEANNKDYLIHHLFKGKQFVPYPYSVVGSPNHADLDILEDGILVYDGLLYKEIPLMYNLVDDVVVSRHPVRMVNVILEPHLIQAFQLGDDRFVNLTDKERALAPGLYQVIYDGDRFVSLARRSKALHNYRNGSILERRYNASVDFYLYFPEEDRVQLIRTQSDLLRIAPESRRELRRLIRSQGLRFKKEPEQVIATVLEFIAQSN